MIGHAITRRGVMALFGGAAAAGASAALPGAAVSMGQMDAVPATAINMPDSAWRILGNHQDRHRESYGYRIGGCAPDIACLGSWSPAARMRRQAARDEQARSFLVRLRTRLGLDR